MNLIREERVVYRHQIDKKHQVHIACDDSSVMVELHQRIKPPSEKEIDTMIDGLRTQFEAHKGNLYVNVVRVKGEPGCIATLASTSPLGELMFWVKGLGPLTETQCAEKMQACLDNAAKLHIRNRMIAQKAKKTGFMTLKGQVLFARAFHSNHEVMQCELQTARDITSAMMNMDITAVQG